MWSVVWSQGDDLITASFSYLKVDADVFEKVRLTGGMITFL